MWNIYFLFVVYILNTIHTYMDTENGLITNVDKFGMVLDIGDVFVVVAPPNNKDSEILFDAMHKEKV